MLAQELNRISLNSLVTAPADLTSRSVLSDRSGGDARTSSYKPATVPKAPPVEVAPLKERSQLGRKIADGEFVVVETKGNNRTRRGMEYNNSICNVLRLEAGKLKEWTEYSDTLLVAAVLGDPADWRVPAG